MNITVLANCQVWGIKHALKELVPGANIEEIPLANLSSNEARQAAADKIKKSDYLFSQVLETENFGPLQSARLAREVKNITLFPAVIFTGFHPDHTYLSDGAGNNLAGPFGSYHSLLLTAAFSAGMPANRAAKLFNAYFFEKLKYFNEYEIAKAYLVKKGRELDYDFEQYFDGWQANGPFMHTINHPTIRVLSSIAKDAAVKAGLCAANVAVPQIKYDGLGYWSQWPVYPEISRRLGLDYASSLNFPKYKAPVSENSPNFEMVPHRQYISESFDYYKSLPKRVFQNARILDFRQKILSEVL